MYNLEIFYFLIFVYRLQKKLVCQKKRTHYNKGDDVDKKNHEDYINKLIRGVELSFCTLKFILIVFALMFVVLLKELKILVEIF